MEDIMCNSHHIAIRVMYSICSAMVPWTFGAQAAGLPPDPDNAALLYYQAILTRPKPDETTFWLIDKVLRGADPNEQVREYLHLQMCRQTIELAVAATQIPQCNWGIKYSRGLDISPGVILELRQLCSLLEVSARILAADGKPRAALERCLAIRRFAAHIGTTSLTFGTSQFLNTRALICIRQVLGSMPLDTDTLTWLQDQLRNVQGTPWSPARKLEFARDLFLQLYRTDLESLAFWIGPDAEAIKNESAREELLGRARQLCDKVLESAVRIIGSDMLYEEKCRELKKLEDAEVQAQSSDDVAPLLDPARWAMAYYIIMVRNAAYLNATRAAIDIYIIRAKTGQLPQTLPDGLPKDPYSGKDFEYEITKDGFTLRCRVKPVDSSEVRQFPFKVAK